METLNIQISKTKMMISKVALGILTLAFFVLFVIGWINKWTLEHLVGIFDHLFVMISLGLASLIFAYGFIFMLKRAKSSKPALVLEHDGFIDNVGLLKGQKYLYKDIDRFEIKTVAMSKVIAVYLKDVNAFLEQQTGIKKRLLKSTYTQYGAPVTLAAKAFDYPMEDLLVQLNNRLTAGID